jgi:hypothetical protein
VKRFALMHIVPQHVCVMRLLTFCAIILIRVAPSKHNRPREP